MNNEKTRYMTFYENWIDVMEMCTPEEWYELCKIITNLRFNGIDTDAKTISNMKIKMAWTVIRPSILKSNRNSRYQDNKEKKQTTEPQQQVVTIPTEVKEDLNNTNETEETKEDMGTFIGYIETPTQDENFDNFSDTLYKLIDEYESIINHTTEAIAKAETSDDIVVVYQAKQAKIKLKEISEKLIEEIDKSNFYKYINEKVGIKVKNLGYETV